MTILRTLAPVALLLLASCYQFEVTAQAGYSQLSLDGDIGYVNGTQSTAVSQDLGSAFGLGDDQGDPYARLGFDFGTPTLAVSGFMFEDSGQGLLTADFGGIPQGLTVFSDFELASAKVSYAFEIPLGPVSISPGLAVNFIDLSIFVRDSAGVGSEEVQLQAPLPMGFVRGEVDVVGVVQLVGEVGYIGVDIEDVDASLLDIEALLEVTALEPLNLFVGYRAIEFDAEGEIDDDSADFSIGISGFLIGGGVRF